MLRSKIGFKLIFAVGGVTIATMAILSFVIITSQKRALISQLEHNVHQLSETIKSSTKYDMLFNHRERLHQIIDTIGDQPGIEKVRIFNKEGEIIYSPDKGEIGRLVDKKAEACYVCHAADLPLEKLTVPERTRIFSIDHDHKSLAIINPIYNEPSCWEASCHAHSEEKKVLGVLDVAMSLDVVESALVENQTNMILFALGLSVAVSLILWYLVQHLVGTPVSALVDATKTIASGQLDYQMAVTKSGEFEHLGNSFNRMTRKLSDAQRQLYQSDKLASIGRLAAGVAHEINNPLTGVLTYSSMLLKHDGFSEEVTNDLNVIVNETKRCREIVKRLLDFARPMPAEKTAVDVPEIVGRTLSILEGQLRKKQIVVQTDFGRHPSPVHADPNQLQQILVNLVVNAMDAIGKSGGTIKISSFDETSGGDSFVKIQVSDSGSGIAREDLNKIFEPFYTTKGTEGTGLGLSVVWGIMEEHDAKISVESEKDQGTTFILSFPVEQMSPAGGPVKSIDDSPNHAPRAFERRF